MGLAGGQGLIPGDIRQVMIAKKLQAAGFRLLAHWEARPVIFDFPLPYSEAAGMRTLNKENRHSRYWPVTSAA
jgi:hypothetical protein